MRMKKKTIKTVGVATAMALLIGTPVGRIAASAPVNVFASEGDNGLVDTATTSENNETPMDTMTTSGETNELLDTTVPANKYAVRISISVEDPKNQKWFDEKAKVKISAVDLKGTGKFHVMKAMAKISEDGSFEDVTDDMSLEISENCSVYVEITDQDGTIYTANRYIKCFDKEKPTLNASVYNGRLSVKAYDGDSGVKAIYVDDYEFKKLTNGQVVIRLQKFDSGYEHFSIQAMDNAGNMSEVYEVANPYYNGNTDDSQTDPSISLPSDVLPTSPTNAIADVIDHVTVDANGNVKKKKKSNKGREFYTIKTKNDKTFYLVIDRSGSKEKTYFLTSISENDLLNVTDDTNINTLPQNSATNESALPDSGSGTAAASTTNSGALPNNNISATELMSRDNEVSEVEDTAVSDAAVDDTALAEVKPEESDNSTLMYIVIGVVAPIFFLVSYYFKVIKKRRENFVSSEDDIEEEEETEQEETENDWEDEEEDDKEEDEEI